MYSVTVEFKTNGILSTSTLRSKTYFQRIIKGFLLISLHNLLRDKIATLHNCKEVTFVPLKVSFLKISPDGVNPFKN